jgi:hypothetical protein
MMVISEEIVDRAMTRKTAPVSLAPSHHFTFNMLAKSSNNILNAKGQTGDKPHHMTINTRAYMTRVRSHTTVRLSERKPSQLYVLQTAMWEAFKKLWYS